MHQNKYYSPLRYPGGKRKLANFVKLLLGKNRLLDGYYAEPYAGGASVALALLFNEYVSRIYINDVDRGIHAFWYCVLNDTEKLCKLIWDTPITMDVWERQREIQVSRSVSPLELAYSTFFLNRTNRSGIISGGVIGGKQQSGKWKIDARFNKGELIARIEKIARYKERIFLYNLDALQFINDIAVHFPSRSLIYFDPPYFVKGKSKLYTNFYDEADHEKLAMRISSLSTPWIVSYDNVEPIRKLYAQYRSLEYGIHYSAQSRYQGKEVIFFANQVAIPLVDDPVRVKNRDLRQLELAMRIF